MASNINISKPRGLSLPLRICLITFALVIGLLVAASLFLGQMPGVQAWQRCEHNMSEVSAALSRYRDVNGELPPNLEALRGKYLNDPSVLRCPSDRSGGDKPSYRYNPKATGNDVMLECDRERLPGQRLRIIVTADGTQSMIPELDMEKTRRP